MFYATTINGNGIVVEADSLESAHRKVLNHVVMEKAVVVAYDDGLHAGNRYYDAVSPVANLPQPQLEFVGMAMALAEHHTLSGCAAWLRRHNVESVWVDHTHYTGYCDSLTRGVKINRTYLRH